MNSFRKMDWNSLIREYGLDGSRLLPWEGIKAPFGGAWCIVRSGTESLRHSHNEHEMFIVVQGRAQIRISEEYVTAEKGDIIQFPLNVEHSVKNDSDADFHFYTIWWDNTTAKDFLQVSEA